MQVRESYLQIAISLPFPRGVIFIELLTVLNKLFPDLLDGGVKMSMSSPLSSYANFFTFINNELSLVQLNSLKKELYDFSIDTLRCLKDDRIKQSLLIDELHRVLGIRISLNEL